MESPSPEERLTYLEARLSRLETYLNLSTPNSAKRFSEPNSEKYPPASLFNTTAHIQPQPARDTGPSNWLGIIAVVCFIVAAGFIIKLSIDSGWLTHTRQIGIAALLGLSLIGTGLVLLRSDRSYASLLPGAGIIILYLTTFAAHRYYALISFETALTLIGAISCGCIFLYTQIKNDVYATTAAIGSYLAPSILGLHAAAPFSLYYFMFCSVAFATISLWLQSRILIVVSSYLALFMSGLVGLGLQQNQLLAVILAVHFAIFSIGTYLYTIYNDAPLSEEEAWAFLPILVLFYGIEYHLVDQLYAGWAPWVSLGFGGALIGLYASARRYFPNNLESQSLIISYATLVGFHSVYLELLPDAVRPWLFVCMILALTFLPFNSLAQKENSLFVIPSLAGLAILVIEYATMISHLLNESSDSQLIVSLAAVASLWTALIFANERIVKALANGYGLLGAAHALAIPALYRLTDTVSSLAVSASWLLYAVAVMGVSFTRKDKTMAKSALFVLAFAAGKALLYDASTAPTLVRIFCLLLTGAVLYGCGIFMRQIGHWELQKEKTQNHSLNYECDEIRPSTNTPVTNPPPAIAAIFWLMAIPPCKLSRNAYGETTI